MSLRTAVSLLLYRLCVFTLILVPCITKSENKPPAIPGSPEITDMSFKDFNSTLLSLDPNQNAVIEFYASWCPHCRHFAPEFSRAAAFLSRQPAIKPLFIGRADCAVEVSLCSLHKVDSYPQVTIATVKQFLAVEHKDYKKFPLSFKNGHANGVVEWVGTTLNTTLPELTTTWKPEDESAPKKTSTETTSTTSSTTTVNANASLTWDVEDVETATIMMMKQSVDGLKGSHARSALQVLLAVWSVAHPSSRCIEGAEKLRQQLPKIWPAESEVPGVELRSFHICGEAEEQAWRSCKGSTEQTRGYTCGLWTMWHSLSVRLPDANGGRLLMSALRAFASHFFQCEECRMHFSQILADSATMQVVTKQQGVIWLWKTHNKVNARIAGEEKQKGTGDPVFPKVQFPPQTLCPECQLGGQGRKELEPIWNEKLVLNFLFKHYGPVALASSEQKLAEHSSQSSHSSGTQDLILSEEGQTNRPQPPLSTRYLSSQLQTWLAILAMALIMAWYCSRARSHKAHATSREGPARMRQHEPYAAMRRKVRSTHKMGP